MITPATARGASERLSHLGLAAGRAAAIADDVAVKPTRKKCDRLSAHVGMLLACVEQLQREIGDRP